MFAETSSSSATFYLEDTSQSVGVTATARLTPWLVRALEKLKGLARLEENWDSYGSRPINPCAYERAAEILKHTASCGMAVPDIFPVSGGGVQLEWENARHELEIGILPNGEMEFLITDGDGEMRENQISPSWSGEIYRLAIWFNNQQSGVAHL